MSTVPPPANDPRSQQRRKPKQEEGDSLTDLVLDEFDGCSLGCLWSLVTLPFRIVWKLFNFFTD